MPTPINATLCEMPTANAADPEIESICVIFGDESAISAYLAKLEETGWQRQCQGGGSCTILSPPTDGACQHHVSMYRGAATEVPKSSSVRWFFTSSDCIPVLVDVPVVEF